MEMKVLVVGGAGYIGGCVTDRLLEQGIPFTVYDNLTYENHYLKPVEFIYGDVRNRAKLAELLPQHTHVIWLAAIVGDGACVIKPELTRAVNAESVAWLAEHFNGRIIFTSTCSVYGANNEPVSETSPTQPLSVYAQTKLEAERHLEGKNALLLRLGTAFGRSDHYSRVRMDLAVNYMTMNAISKGSLTIFGGDQWRPFMHVRDIGATIVESLSKKEAGIYNWATVNASIREIGEAIRQHTNCTVTFTTREFEDHRNYRADTAKAHAANLLPVSTPYTVAFGVKEMQELVCSQRIKNLEHEFYSNQRWLLKAIDSYENGLHH